uniref:Uncharacterized protein n=1 Tax=Setaria italica TaxID=4555 RepID=K3ZGT4_SETIT
MDLILYNLVMLLLSSMHQMVTVDSRYFQYSEIGLCCGHRSIFHKLCTDLNFASS